MNVNTLHHKSADYPNTLHNIFDAPKHLYSIGALRQDLPLLAVVGTRNPTHYGTRVVSSLLLPLLRAGIGIVSGLAFGIDKQAHLLALEESAYTIAVLPSGLPDIYPKSHYSVARRIVKSGGAVCSEYRAPHKIMKHHFLARNRIVAGLADGVLIIEATERSGTFNTANHALEQGKTVMSVPGSIYNRASVGTNGLIRVGAEPVSSADDIMEVMGWSLEQQGGPTADNKLEANILEVLQAGPLDIHSIEKTSSLCLRDIQQTLSILEIKGKVRLLGAQMYGIRS